MNRQSEPAMRGRILVVDDDPSIRHTLHIAMTKAGYELLLAQDGEEATPMARQGRGPRDYRPPHA